MSIIATVTGRELAVRLDLGCVSPSALEDLHRSCWTVAPIALGGISFSNAGEPIHAQPEEDTEYPISVSSPCVCVLASCADRLSLPFNRPLEKGLGRGLDLAPAALLPDRFLGHELRPRERRMLRLSGLVMVAVDSVPVDRDRRVPVSADGYLPFPTASSTVGPMPAS